MRESTGMNVRDLKSSLHALIKEAVISLYKQEINDFVVEVPANRQHGDFATNIALLLAPILKQAPMEIAKSIHYEMQGRLPDFSRILLDGKDTLTISVASPGFINFKLSNVWYHNMLSQIVRSSASYGASTSTLKKKVVLEYSQPNTNKPQHVGHARNNFLGSSLAEIYKYVGYEVIRANYIGDIGIHICKSMLMYIKYGNNELPTKKPDHYVGDFYILFEKEVAENPSLMDEAQELLRKWEAGDKEVHAIWEKMNSWVYTGWEETYKNQNVGFDVLEYESKNIDIGKEIVDVAVEKGIAEKDETGAIIARLEQYDLPDKVLLRSDGTSLYITKDLQLAKDGYEKYKFDKRLYVVDYRQGDYFSQVFKILQLLGFKWASQLVHVQYGTVSLPEGKMSSRTGTVVNADTVFETLTALESQEVEKSLSLDKVKDNIVAAVSLAAFRYSLLKVDPKQNIVFSYDKVTKFDGDTGPYLLYSYARSMSLLTKAGLDVDTVQYDADMFIDISFTPKEEMLLHTLSQFPDVVHKAADSLAPNVIAQYLFDLAQAFNSFYAESRILDYPDATVREFRVLLTYAFSVVLKSGLSLLCIPVVERM